MGPSSADRLFAEEQDPAGSLQELQDDGPSREELEAPRRGASGEEAGPRLLPWVRAAGSRRERIREQKGPVLG